MSTAATPHEARSGVLFGAAYYAEYHDTDRVDRDLDLMVEAGFTVIRVGESVWSTWEPRDGVFELDWLQPVLDGAASRGISVILGTPTYAVPPWLQTLHPEIAAQQKSGAPTPWGGRQEVDYSHPAFRFHAERVVRRILDRYAGHPAVIGYQVDNEPGVTLFYNPSTFLRFVRRLSERYGDVDTLNREWGLTYWSHRITEWSELWRPEGNTFPQYDLAWRRFQAELTTEMIAWQADVVREYARPEQFVTTCLQYPRPGVDERAVFEALDVTAGNPYYGMQDHLDLSTRFDHINYWTTSGVPGLVRQADRMFASRQSRFLVTETNAQAIGSAEHNYPPYEGQLKQAAFALISRGASMIEYWHWHTLPYGAETYWGGILPHSLVPGRVYREISALGAELRALGDALDGYEPDADVAVLWSTGSRYALQFHPPLSKDGEPDPESYERIVDAFHSGVVLAGAQARILHLQQAIELGAKELARRFPVLIAAAVYAAPDDVLDLLRDYAAAGGHLMLGIRTGYADTEARARVAVAPDRLHGAAGVRYEEFSNVDAPVEVVGSAGFPAPEGSAGDGWIDGLIADGAETLAHYEHPWFGRFPAVTSAEHGSGRITTVGTIPSPALASALVRWALPDEPAVFGGASEPTVSAASGTTGSGRRAWFVFNWSWTAACVRVDRDLTEATTGETYRAGDELPLGPWSAQILLEGPH